jgi:hypothetical protein
MPTPAMLSAQSWRALRGEPAECADQTGIRQAVGVTQEGSSTGRWLSRGKGVGRCVTVGGGSVCDSFEGRFARGVFWLLRCASNTHEQYVWRGKLYEGSVFEPLVTQSPRRNHLQLGSGIQVRAPGCGRCVCGWLTD